MPPFQMNRRRFLSAVLVVLVLFSLPAALSPGVAAKPQGSTARQTSPKSLKIGVFPVRRFDKESEPFLAGLSRVVRTNLEQAGVADIVPLAWPEAGSDEPTFETLVNRGREAGCNGVLALRLQAMSFTIKTVSVPFVGKTSLAEASFGLSGGLIDVASGAAISPVKAESQKKDPRYRGFDADLALRSEFGEQYFDESLLGQAGYDAIKQVVADVRTGLPGLTAGPVGLERRTRAPEGVGFGQDSFSMTMTDGYDHRGSVSVVNRGKEPRTFMIAPLEVPAELVVGLLGQGAPDAPHVLQPGQWKEVRFIANAPQTSRVQSVRLGLFTAPAGGAPSSSGTPDDQAAMNLQWASSTQAITWNVLGQDPVTLVYTCQLKNNSDKDIWNASVQPSSEDADLVRIEPWMKNVRIPANGTVTFQVIPELLAELRAMDVSLESSAGNIHDVRKFQFAVPEGKRVYFGLGHTSESSSAAGSGCSNQGQFSWWSDAVWSGTTDRDGSPCAYKSCFRQNSSLAMGAAWKWITEHMGGSGPEKERGRAADVRGATIRTNVGARLPDMEKDSITHPMASSGRECVGLAFCATDPGKSTSVLFVAERPSKGRVWTFDDGLEMNQAGHDARWPYIRTRWSTSQAYLVWEDTSPGKKSDVAFRASGERMSSWKPVQYLTDHGRGVDDPVVQVDDQGNVGVAWNDLRDGSGHIYFRISRNGGATFGPERAMPRPAGESQAWPQFTFAPQRGFTLVYVSKTGGETRIVSRDLDDQGVPLGTPSLLSHAGASAGEPQVAGDESGQFYAVWREGEGSASEVWFARRSAGSSTWTTPRQITRDSVYSEYPLVWVDGKTLFASYHADAMGALDLKYILASENGGDTWGEAVAQPSLAQDAADRTFVEVRFSLQNPRSSYPPFDTTVLLNGRQVGEIKRAVPEGTYIWEALRGVVGAGAQSLEMNQINLKFDNLSGGHYILAADTRIIAKRRYTQVPVVAASQAEADQLAGRGGVGLNHSAPDLALAANSTEFPLGLAPGRKINLRLQAFNLGEATANDVRVAIFAFDPRGAIASPDSDKLGEVRISSIAPGEVKPVEIGITYDPARTPRIYASLSAREKDYFPADNVMAFSFTKGESNQVPPLFGTDIPDVLRAPELLNMVSVPNMRGFADMMSLPGLGSLVGKPGLRPVDTREVGNILQGKLNRLGLGNLGLDRLKKP